MKQIIHISLISLSIFLFFSCGQKMVVETTVNPQNQQWNTFKPIDFNFEIKDTSKPYKLSLAFKIDQQKMGEKSIPITYNFAYPNGENRADFKNLVLDSASKKGGLFEFALLKYKQFNHPGNYKLSVAQTTHKFNLEGIESVSLRVYETEVRKANQDEE